MNKVRLMTLDPGHFHAALVQKSMYPQVDKKVHVFAPLGGDLIAHLGRIIGFNTRKEQPTAWELEIHSEPFFLQRMLDEKPGNVVVLSGRNRAKIDYILAAVQSGLNVLADKPWILSPEDLPKLQSALDTADQNGLVAYDIMTERFEITSFLQRELIQDADLFGEPIAGSAEEPGICMESVHYLMKSVAGVPLRRPEWFFNVAQQGEGLSDVGTHLVDLIPWMLFPDQPIDCENDIEILAAKHWPTSMTNADYEKVTGSAEFPPYLNELIKDGKLDYYCNNSVTYSVRGIHVKLDILWGFEAEPGAGDSHLAVVRGSKSRVDIRGGKEQNFRPELYVIANDDGPAEALGDALEKRIEHLQDKYPGVALQKTDEGWTVTIPDKYRIGHEAHFAEVTQQFLKFLDNPKSMPAWEKPNMLAKYYVTTQGVAQSRT